MAEFGVPRFSSADPLIENENAATPPQCLVDGDKLPLREQKATTAAAGIRCGASIMEYFGVELIDRDGVQNGRKPKERRRPSAAPAEFGCESTLLLMLATWKWLALAQRMLGCRCFCLPPADRGTG